MKQFKKVLVANRGEIAIRVFRALNELGIVTVSIYSKEDRYALFRSKADESYPLNPDKGPIDAYLDIDTIIKIALNAGVDAIHPGYGFLSENPEFVDACEQNGITFIGPSSDIICIRAWCILQVTDISLSACQWSCSGNETINRI